jgi:tektin-2
MEDEIAELEADIRAVEEAIRAKIPPTKLAQTRLENRTYRPNVELCRDAPQYGLTDEVKQLEATKAALVEKHKQARYVKINYFEGRIYRLRTPAPLGLNMLD